MKVTLSLNPKRSNWIKMKEIMMKKKTGKGNDLEKIQDPEKRRKRRRKSINIKMINILMVKIRIRVNQRKTVKETNTILIEHCLP